MATNDLLIRLLLKNEASKELNAALTGFRNFGGAVAGALGAVGISIGAIQLARFSLDATKMAASAQLVETSFANLSASAGVNSRALKARLDDVAGSWATDTELMQTANMALQGGTAELVQSLPRLFEVARAAAVASGQDVGYVYDTLVRGIIRGSPLLIDNANIFVKVGDAQEKYAVSIGKTVEQLTAQEKQLSLLNAVMGDADRIIKATGVTAGNAAEKIKSMEVATKELKKAWGDLMISMGVPEGIGKLAQGISEIADTESRSRLRAISIEIVALTKAMSDAGQEGGKELYKRALGLAINPQPIKVQIDAWEALRAEILGLDPTKVDALSQSIGDLVALNGKIAQTANAVADLSASTAFDPMVERRGELEDRQQAIYDAALRIREARERARDEEAAAARDYAERWRTAYRERVNDARSMAESVLTAGLQVSALDMAQTQAGLYQDKPLEAARRLADIAVQGLASPWAKFFEIPPEVLAGGEQAVKAWASQVQTDVQNLTRPDLVDWDAFIAGFEKAQSDAAARELTLDIAVGKLAQAGLLTAGTKEAQKAQVAKMLGLDTPELAAAGITAGFRAAFEQDNPATALMNTFTGANKTNLPLYETAGRASGKAFGKQVHDAALAELDPFMDDLANRVLKRLPAAGTEPPP